MCLSGQRGRDAHLPSVVLMVNDFNDVILKKQFSDELNSLEALFFVQVLRSFGAWLSLVRTIDLVWPLCGVKGG